MGGAAEAAIGIATAGIAGDAAAGAAAGATGGGVGSIPAAATMRVLMAASVGSPDASGTGIAVAGGAPAAGGAATGP